MATWTDQIKNVSTMTNRQKSSATLTWDEATFPWNEGLGTWDDPFAYTIQTKNTSVFTNQPKN